MGYNFFISYFDVLVDEYVGEKDNYEVEEERYSYVEDIFDVVNDGVCLIDEYDENGEEEVNEC